MNSVCPLSWTIGFFNVLRFHPSLLVHTSYIFLHAGIAERWKQVVAYHFTGRSVSGSSLRDVILNVISEATKIGLRVICVTSDMGPGNQAMWRQFGIHYKRDSFTTCVPHPEDPSARLHFLADVPHVVKNLCNALLTHKKFILSSEVQDQHKLVSNVVDLAHIQEVVEVQGEGLKLAPSLSSKTTNATRHFSKMKVRNALQLFSKSVSASLRTLVAEEGFPDSYLTTAWFVDCVDTWFNFMSSRHPVMALSKRNEQAFTTATTFLEGFMATVSTLQFSKPGWKPVQTGILMSTRSVLNICSELLDDSFQFLLTSRLTQDCVENLFSVVRSKNATPTSREFKYALRVICVAQFLHSVGSSNYDYDDREYLGELLPSNSMPAVKDVPDTALLENVNTLTVSATCDLNNLEKQSLYYLAGYCAQSLKKQKWACESCVKVLERRSDSPRHQYATLVMYRNFTDGALFEINDVTFQTFLRWETVFRKHEPVIKCCGIGKRMLDDCLTVTPDLPVPDCHPLIERLAKKFINVRLHIVCKQLTDKLNEDAAKTVPMGSKSMAMRALVQKV